MGVMIAFGISGTSSGAHWLNLGTGEDPRLLAGIPRPIRSDEWLVAQGWIVSQVNQGFPDINPMFPGGMDMAVLNELPTWDWSSLFRPHLWGYLFFGLDIGVAWQWWIPALALIIGCYLFTVSLLPRRPITAALIAVAVFFTPMLQWFYTASSLWPVAWALLAMAGSVWVLNDPRRWVRIVWATVVGYTAVTMAMGLYVPFMIPCLVVFLSFAIGYLLRLRPWRESGYRKVLANVSPLAVAGLASVLITAVWVASRIDTFSAIGSTVYPGLRSEPTGKLLTEDPYLAGIGGAPWNEALKSLGPSILGGNPPEGSSVILLSLFVLPGLLWFTIVSFRKGRKSDWLLVSSIACFLLIAAYLVVPGWDALAHVLQFDRVSVKRFRIGFIVLLPLFAVLAIEHADRGHAKKNWIVGLICAGATAAMLLGLWYRIEAVDPMVLGFARTWEIVAALLVATTFLLFLKRGVVLAAASLLIASFLISWGVNPLYRGVYDLSTTDTGFAVEEANAADPGTWVGLGTYETMAVLVETGVASLSGVQTYPPREMWEAIDPTSQYEENWNRLGRVSWILSSEDMTVSNPAPDVIQVSFDPCSEFAQRNVSFVLSDEPATSLSCLLQTAQVHQGLQDMRIYEVIPAGDLND